MKICLLLLMLFISMNALAQQSSLVYVTESFLRGRVLEREQLELPLLDRARIPGKVVLSILVDEQGKVEAAEVLTGHPLLDKSAQKYLMTWKFIPMTDGQVVKKMSGIITVWFDFVKHNPIIGLDLPVVRVLGEDSFEVGKRIFDLNQLLRWLESVKNRDPHPILRLLAKKAPPAEILSQLKAVSGGDIFMHFE